MYHKVEVESLKMIESPLYVPQMRRTFKSNITGEVITSVVNRVENQQRGNKFEQITPGVFSGMSNQIISLEAQPEGSIDIVNGWNNKRYLFILSLNCYYRSGAMVREILQGYTDMADTSYTGKPNPDTLFFINSITTLVNQAYRTPMALIDNWVIRSSYNLITNQYTYQNAPYHEHKITPEDVYHAMDWEQYRAGSSMLNDPITIYDTTTMNGMKTSFINKGNLLPSNYVADVVNAYISASNDNNSINTDVSSRARTLLSNKTPSENWFINRISRNSAYGVNRFYLDDLSAMCPDYLNRMIVSPRAHNSAVAGFIDPSQSEYFTGADIVTQAATNIVASTMSLMGEMMLAGVTFSATNMSFGLGHNVAEPIFHIQEASSFIGGIDISPQVERFKRKFISDVLNDISYGGSIGYEIAVDASVLDNATVRIRFDGSDEMQYSQPVFADALLSPMVTGQRQKLDVIASDFNSLLSEVPSQGIILPNSHVSSYHSVNTGVATTIPF
ncbi:MAG: hypothetical protein E6Q68_00880 [Polynucleobacter sp.]|nr:MAG: hypothetical protein E6Q68_00880 [Polynucleobacter sp.]